MPSFGRHRSPFSTPQTPAPAQAPPAPSYGNSATQQDLGLPQADNNNRDRDQVYVADTGSDMDAWCWLTGQEQASSSTEIANAVVENSGGVPVQSVEIKGHGSPGCQTIGVNSALRAPLTAQQRQDFANIGAAMDPGGVIILAGCNVAEGPTGIALMQEVASASQRTVTAGIAVQLPLDGIEGSQVYVSPDGSVSSQVSAYDPLYDAVANGTMEGVQAVKEVINDGQALVQEGVLTVEQMIDDGLAMVEGAQESAEEYWPL